MTARRWWLLAVVAASLLSGAVVALSVGPGPQLLTVAAILVAFNIFWGIVARPDEEGTPRAVIVLIVTIGVAGALTSVNSSMAFFQTIAFPAVWTLLATIRRSIIACAVLAVVEVVGFLIALGVNPPSVTLALTIEGISFIFAVAMGVWITRIAEFSREKQRLLDELTAAQDELAVLHRDAGVTSERERLARELHDTIAQSLTGLVLLSQRSRRELVAGTLGDDTLELIESGARDTLAETRALVAGSAPVELDAGITPALTRLGERIQRETGLEVTTTAEVDGGAALTRDTEVVLLRCAQEGLSNVRKHAGARAARVDLRVDASTAILRVTDDGRGFDPGATSGGFGLSGLRDRIALVGGTLEVDGTAGATTLTATLPLEAPA